MQLVVAHKGKKSWRCRVRGHEAHSSLTPRGVNAVQIACEIVAYIAAMARRFRDAARRDEAYDVPYTTRARRHDPRRHRAQHRAARLLVRLRDPPPAVRRPGRAVRRDERLRRALPPGDARGRAGRPHRVRRAVDDARLRHARTAATIADLGHELCYGRRRAARCRSAPRPSLFHGASIPTVDLRPGPHRAGAPAERVGDARAARALRSVHAAPRRATAVGVSAPAPAGATGGAPPFPPPAIEVPFPDISRWEAGNTGIPYVWTFASPDARTARHRAGADARQRGVRRDRGRLRCSARACARARGTLTFAFANVAAYEAFDRADPYASRCVDEDFNRLWSARRARRPAPDATTSRARASCARSSTRADYLLDLHSMTDPCPPLALAGTRSKGLELARAVGVPVHIVIDAGHAAGRRLRDYAFFDDPADPRARAAGRMRPALGARGARGGARGDAALPAPPRHDATASDAQAHLGATPPPPQRAIEVTDAVTIRTSGSRSRCRCTGSRSCRRPARCSRATAAPTCARPTTTAC